MGKEFTERRKYKRFHAQEGAFVSPRTHAQKFWQILDISKGGLSFRYIPQREDLKKSSELDILTHDTLFAHLAICQKEKWDDQSHPAYRDDLSGQLPCIRYLPHALPQPFDGCWEYNHHC